jgi:hypothetical protein
LGITCRAHATAQYALTRRTYTGLQLQQLLTQQSCMSKASAVFLLKPEGGQ